LSAELLQLLGVDPPVLPDDQNRGSPPYQTLARVTLVELLIRFIQTQFPGNAV